MKIYNLIYSSVFPPIKMFRDRNILINRSWFSFCFYYCLSFSFYFLAIEFLIFIISYYSFSLSNCLAHLDILMFYFHFWLYFCFYVSKTRFWRLWNFFVHFTYVDLYMTFESLEININIIFLILKLNWNI